MKLSEIVNPLAATLYGKDLSFNKVFIDSRIVEKGCLFVAVKGENCDGHDYIADAIENGATSIIISDKSLLNKYSDVSILLVKDTLQALGDLARYWRNKFTLPLIGITGSCGKTTVKEMTYSILSVNAQTHVTTGNLNNQFGLPLTLLSLNGDHKYAVIEMGASVKNDINYLAKIAIPCIATVTNVACAHFQGFGSIEEIAQEKGSIYENLADDGIAILNQDGDFAQYFKKVIQNRKTYTFGLGKNADIKAQNVKLNPQNSSFNLTVKNQEQLIELNVPGMHNVYNALNAAAICYALDIPLEIIAQGLKLFSSVNGRLKIFTNDNFKIIDDTYNANLASVEAAINVLAQYNNEKVFVFGDMAELGGKTQEHHKEVGEKAKKAGVDKLLAVGANSKYAFEAFGDGAKHYANKHELIEDLKNHKFSDITFLVKGSRSAGMEEVVSFLKKNG